MFSLSIFITEKMKLPSKDPVIKLVPNIKDIGIDADS